MRLEQRSLLQCWLAAAVAQTAEELAGYAGVAAAAGLWQQHQEQQPTHTAARKAHLALACMCDGLRLLLQQPRPSAAVDCLAQGCQGILCTFLSLQRAPSGDAQWWRVAAQLAALADCCCALAEGAQVQPASLTAELWGLAADAVDACLALQAAGLCCSIAPLVRVLPPPASAAALAEETAAAAPRLRRAL